MNKMRKSEKGAEKVMKYVLFHCFYGIKWVILRVINDPKIG